MGLWINGVYQAAKAGILSILNAVFNAATNSLAVIETDPDRFSAVIETAWDTANLAAGTIYWPDADGASMFGFKDLSFTGKFIDADGTVTLTIEATDDEDGTTADWIDITQSFYDAVAHAYGNASITVTNGTVTFAWSADSFNWNLYRFKLVTSGATNTIIVKQRRQW